jgi:hypothetical protein
VELSIKKNKRGEMMGRCREQRKGGRGEMQRYREQRKGGGGRLHVGLGLGNFLFILVLFLSGGLVEPIQFGSIGFRL